MVSEPGKQELKSAVDLQDFEYQEMVRAAVEIDPQATEDSLNSLTTLSAGENILVGSSPQPGAVFHLNLPLARVGGVPLELINRARQKLNLTPRPFPIRTADDLILVWFEYRDLTEELMQEDQLATIKVIGVTDLRKHPIDPPENLDQLIKAKISAGREKEKQALEERVRGLASG